MGDMLDKAKAKLDKMENKAHETKGKVEQKAKDMKEQEKTETHTAM